MPNFKSLLVIVALAIASYIYFSDSKPVLSITALVKENMNEFISETNKELDRIEPGCVSIDGPLPRPAVWRHLPCKVCQDLEAAGFLEFKEGRFHLLEAGHPYARDINSAGAKLCFAEVKVHKVIESLAAIYDTSPSKVSIKYIPEIIEPAPFLFTQEARNLKLPEPQKTPESDSIWVSDSQIITFGFSKFGDDMSLSPWRGFRYGKYALTQEANPWH